MSEEQTASPTEWPEPTKRKRRGPREEQDEPLGCGGWKQVAWAATRVMPKLAGCGVGKAPECGIPLPSSILPLWLCERSSGSDDHLLLLFPASFPSLTSL